MTAKKKGCLASFFWKVFVPLVVVAIVLIAVVLILATGPAVALSFLVLLFGFLADASAAGGPAGKLLYALVPDAQHFWTADALARGGTVPASHTLRAALYAATYCAAVLALGCVSFRKKDL